MHTGSLALPAACPGIALVFVHPQGVHITDALGPVTYRIAACLRQERCVRTGKDLADLGAQRVERGISNDAANLTSGRRASVLTLVQ